jgi:CxxC-x17-CxxC domain-containing protein
MNKFRKPHGNGWQDRKPFGGGGGFRRPDSRGASRPQFGSRRPDAPEQYDAICSSCGKACRVPFRPNGQKPVYCRECFGNPSRSSDGKERFIRRDTPAVVAPLREFRKEPSEIAELKQQVVALNAKMDSILRAVESLRHASDPSVSVTMPSSAVAPKSAKKDTPKKKIVSKKAGKKK